MERDNHYNIEFRELTQEETNLIRSYVWLDNSIALLDSYEEEGAEVTHLEREDADVRTDDYDPEMRIQFIHARQVIADVAFQQGFAIHLLIARENSEFEAEEETE